MAIILMVIASSCNLEEQRSQMSSSPRVLLVNSTLSFVVAFLLTTLIHESGHYFSYLALGAYPVLHHNYVELMDPQISSTVRIVAGLAGPAISLLQGVVACGIVLSRKPNTPSELLALWVGLLGLVNFCGYMILTPLSTVGDTGRVADLLLIPFAIRIGIAILGVVLLLLAVLRMGREFSRFIPAGLALRERRRYVNALLVVPIVVGSLVNAALALPVVATLSIIYPAMSPYVILSSYGKALNAVNLNTAASHLTERVSGWLVVFALAAVLLNRLLVPGF